MFSSIVLLLAFCIVYIFIIEIFTVLFRLTGLTEEKSRFEVISLLTASGFTTSQSEAITISKKRRKLASATMIFGYIFSLIIVSIIVNVFLNMSKSEINTFVGISVTLLSVFIVIFTLLKSKTAKIYFDLIINKIYIKLSTKMTNNILIIDIYANKIMANIHLTVIPGFLIDKPLKDSTLKEDHGIQVLIIKRDGNIVEPVTGHTILHKNDDIIVFGKEKEIKKLFEHI